MRFEFIPISVILNLPRNLAARRQKVFEGFVVTVTGSAEGVYVIVRCFVDDRTHAGEMNENTYREMVKDVAGFSNINSVFVIEAAIAFRGTLSDLRRNAHKIRTSERRAVRPCVAGG